MMVDVQKKSVIPEYESFLNFASTRIHNAKNTCKALAGFFNDLKEVEESYANGLKKLLNSGTMMISLNKAKENELACIRGIIDITLSGLLQIAENHNKMAEYMKYMTISNLNDVLNKLRETKKKLMKDIEEQLIKDLNKAFDKVKKLENELKTLQKKFGQTRFGTPEAQILQGKINEIELSIMKVFTEINSNVESNKTKFSQMIVEFQTVEEYRLCSLKNICQANSKKYTETYQQDLDTNCKLMSVFDRTQIDLELGRLKSLIIETNKDQYQQQQHQAYADNPRNSTSRVSIGNSGIESGNSSSISMMSSSTRSPNKSQGNPRIEDSPSSQDSFSISENHQKLENSNTILTSIITNLDDNNNNKGNGSSGGDNPNAYNDGDSWIKYPKFQYIPNMLMINKGYTLHPPHQHRPNTLEENFDEKAYKSVLYAMFINHMQVYSQHGKVMLGGGSDVVMRSSIRYASGGNGNSGSGSSSSGSSGGGTSSTGAGSSGSNSGGSSGGDDTKTQEMMILIGTIKNKFILTIKDVKLIEKVFRLENIEGKKSIFKQMIIKIGDMIMSKSVYNLTPEEQSYIFIMLKHIYLLMTLNIMWKYEIIKMIDKPQNIMEISKANEEYATMCGILSRQYTSNVQQAFESINTKLQSQYLLDSMNAFNYPVNTSVIEVFLIILFEVKDCDQKIFIENWEIFFMNLIDFGNMVLGIDAEAIYLLIFKNIFTKYIKKHILSLNATKLLNYQNDLNEFFNKHGYIVNISSANINNSKLLMPLALDIEINTQLKLILTRDIWTDCMSMIQSMKRLLPNNKHIIHIILTCANIGFHYQKDELKLKTFIENICEACKLYGFHLYRLIKGQIMNKEIPKKDGNIPKDNYSVLLMILQLLKNEIELNIKTLIELIIICLPSLLTQDKSEIERQIRGYFIEGLISELINEIKIMLKIEEENHFDNDITQIIDEIARTDHVLSTIGFEKFTLSENLIGHMDKWFMNLQDLHYCYCVQRLRVVLLVLEDHCKKKVLETTLRLESEEEWKLIKNDNNSLNTHTPLDICYVLFNSVKFVNLITNMKFKESCLHKFEDIVYESITNYLNLLLDGLNKSGYTNMQFSNFKPLILPLAKSKTYTHEENVLEKRASLKKNDLSYFDQETFISPMCEDVSSLCLRLGNLYFLENQIKTVAMDLFVSKSIILDKLGQEMLSYRKKFSQKIGLILMNKYILRIVFDFLYNDIDEDEISKLDSNQFHNKYDYSCKRLFSLIIPLIKKANERIPSEYFKVFMIELANIFYIEYSMHIIDQDRTTMLNQYKYGEFLIKEVKIINDFFFPNGLNITLSNNEELIQRIKNVEIMIMYYMADTATLIQEYQKLDFNTQKGRLLAKILARILASRLNDPMANKFCLMNKNYLT